MIDPGQVRPRQSLAGSARWVQQADKTLDLQYTLSSPRSTIQNRLSALASAQVSRCRTVPRKMSHSAFFVSPSDHRVIEEQRQIVPVGRSR